MEHSTSLKIDNLIFTAEKLRQFINFLIKDFDQTKINTRYTLHLPNETIHSNDVEEILAVDYLPDIIDNIHFQISISGNTGIQYISVDLAGYGNRIYISGGDGKKIKGFREEVKAFLEKERKGSKFWYLKSGKFYYILLLATVVITFILMRISYPSVYFLIFPIILYLSLGYLWYYNLNSDKFKLILRPIPQKYKDITFYISILGLIASIIGIGITVYFNLT